MEKLRIYINMEHTGRQYPEGDSGRLWDSLKM